jgi:hypothetical protein
MYDPHQISKRLGVAASLSLISALIVPSAFARPFDEGGELAEPVENPASVAAASASGFDWSLALVVAVVIGLAVLVTTVAVRHAADRRRTQLAAR